MSRFIHRRGILTFGASGARTTMATCQILILPSFSGKILAFNIADDLSFYSGGIMRSNSM